ncbi:hypothetical protein, partial [Enterobacter cloacae]
SAIVAPFREEYLLKITTLLYKPDIRINHHKKINNIDPKSTIELLLITFILFISQIIPERQLP